MPVRDLFSRSHALIQSSNCKPCNMNRDPRLQFRRPIFARDLAPSIVRAPRSATQRERTPTTIAPAPSSADALPATPVAPAPSSAPVETLASICSAPYSPADTPTIIAPAQTSVPPHTSIAPARTEAPAHTPTSIAPAPTLLPTVSCHGVNSIQSNILDSIQEEGRPPTVNGIQESMCAAAITAMGGSDSIDKNVRNFMEAAKALQEVVPEGANLHCFISCPSINNRSGGEESNLFPLVSNLFHTALHASRRGSTVVGQALRDTFLIAHRVSNGRFFTARPSLTIPGIETSQRIPSLILPEWFPSMPDSSEVSPAHESSIPQYILCRHSIMNEIGHLGVARIGLVYTKLFTSIWETGRRQSRVSGRITYARMTPPWLRKNVIFIHGENRNASIPFTLGALPTKNQIKEKNYKFVASQCRDIACNKSSSR